MSINNALISATQDVLRSYLAPELAEKLTEEILERARPEIEAALTELAGFDFAKPVAKGAKAGKAAAKGKPAKAAKAAKVKEEPAAPPVVTVENYAAEAEAN